MKNKKLTVYSTDCYHKCMKEECEVFAANNLEWVQCQCKTEDELIDKLKNATSVCNMYAKFTDKVFDNLPKLKCIVRCGVGVDNVDLDSATRHGVQVCNVPDYGTDEVADHALALMMTLVRKINSANSYVQNENQWGYDKLIPIKRLSQMVVGIVGFGRIGQAFAKRVQALGCKILVTVRHEPTEDIKKQFDYVSFVTLDEVLKNSDVLSLHCGLNQDNKKFMNENAFSKMKTGSYFINVSRGGLVDEDALAVALKKGKLAGAALDVLVKEPMSEQSPLKNTPNLIITPHMAWYSEQASSDKKRMCAEEVVRGALGLKVLNPVNKLK